MFKFKLSPVTPAPIQESVPRHPGQHHCFNLHISFYVGLIAFSVLSNPNVIVTLNSKMVALYYISPGITRAAASTGLNGIHSRGRAGKHFRFLAQ